MHDVSIMSLLVISILQPANWIPLSPNVISDSNHPIVCPHPTTNSIHTNCATAIYLKGYTNFYTTSWTQEMYMHAQCRHTPTFCTCRLTAGFAHGTPFCMCATADDSLRKITAARSFGYVSRHNFTICRLPVSSNEYLNGPRMCMYDTVQHRDVMK